MPGPNCSVRDRPQLPSQLSVLELYPAKFPSFSESSAKPSLKVSKTLRQEETTKFQSCTNQKDPSCLLGPSEAHAALCGYVPSAPQFVKLCNSLIQLMKIPWGSREGPEHTIIWIVGISNNILMFSCLKLCSGFVAILSTHLGFLLFFFFFSSWSIWVRHFWVHLLLFFFFLNKRTYNYFSRLETLYYFNWCKSVKMSSLFWCL